MNINYVTDFKVCDLEPVESCAPVVIAVTSIVRNVHIPWANRLGCSNIYQTKGVISIPAKSPLGSPRTGNIFKAANHSLVKGG